MAEEALDSIEFAIRVELAFRGRASFVGVCTNIAE